MKELIGHFHKLAHYEHKCNTGLLQAIRDNTVTDEKVLQLMSHISAAQTLWIMRILGENTAAAPNIWTIVPVEEIETRFLTNNDRLAKAIDLLADTDKHTISYTNLAGKHFSTGLADILHHVLNHGTYHRAQIATRFKELGMQPVGTDYILYIWESAPSLQPCPI